MSDQCPLITWVNIKKEIKLYIDANMHDGQDRSGATDDRAYLTPDDMEKLVTDTFQDAIIPMVNKHIIKCRNHLITANKALEKFKTLSDQRDKQLKIAHKQISQMKAQIAELKNNSKK